MYSQALRISEKLFCSVGEELKVYYAKYAGGQCGNFLSYFGKNVNDGIFDFGGVFAEKEK